ncbi:MAG: L-aspartate oxidase [Pseudomonadota bacterium]|nr:L-aspartate oxidase [Pseudomonadota bacterium]
MSSPKPHILVLGGGVAGLTVALRSARFGFQVTVISKRSLTEGSSLYAQGGIAAAVDSDDSIESHVKDTMIAGAGLCSEEVVKFVAERSSDAIDWLLEQGVEFTQLDDTDELHLAKEGGHSKRRVVHADDATGSAVVGSLESQVRKNSNIQIKDSCIAIDLITTQKLGESGPNRVIGVYALNLDTEKVETITASAVVIATGGASKAYLYTSNPDTSTGDGIAMAWRAGCRVANMEFIQFHPTCLYHPQAKSFLISEAVRGEGGKLVLMDGKPFMDSYDERAELAPRDIVARAIDYEMKRGGYDSVFLDISHKPIDFLKDHFPTISSRCEDFGFDIAQEAIPVVPAAHYTCGGVVTNLNGLTDIEGLYAVGECAFTGLHGANRLASNSLLECLVIGESVSKDILKRKDKLSVLNIQPPEWDDSQVTDLDELIVITHNWDELRRTMWDYVVIVRTDKRLERAKNRVGLLKQEILEFYSNFKVNNNLIELRNLIAVAEIIVDSALSRKESRGLHYTIDYPEPMADEIAEDTILIPTNFSGSAIN